MIKINLLPIRAAKRKETAVQQLTIFGISVFLVLALVLTAYFINGAQIAATKNDISTANNKISDLKKKLGKLEELKTLKEQVKKKLDVLTQLRKNKSGPAHRLATLSEITPDQLWLTGYSETGADIKISGFAFTEDLIAAFMRSLEASSDYMNVELLVSEQSESGGNKLKRFDISCKLETAASAAKPVAAGAPAPAAAK
ncbi:PilN domain-containing protein [Pelotalea chapellei]|uniref:PilN domain-containing protein n=1 Tax=Pelotalea chapellei TaxID=44671 RepID=A0ABS5U468_9BACT|nr:PilN domain-containing protein [Pelotalea chapellei]MBT1070450.1 PilN domain-containing protein [Pelotalea chapellei]